MQVIASSLRKGNIVEKDNQLYVILSAENIHPGKGTPVTQLAMRRISDGVKVAERYRTTEQVERAFVEDRDFNYLYEDTEGFNFMNNETYEQISGKGEALKCLEGAMWCFYHSSNFDEGVKLAVNLGDDTDTTAAVFGQLAGSFYGVEGIPEYLLNDLWDKKLIEEIAMKLFNSSAL